MEYRVQPLIGRKEIGMDKNVSWYVEKQIERTVANLEKNNMQGHFVPDEKCLHEKIRELIPSNAVVGAGDSVTLFETGIIDLLRSGNYRFLDKHKAGLSGEEKKQIYRDTFSAHTFLSGTNALTEEGELYNIDGNGSRVAPMLYGPEQVIIVAGVNKIVRNLQEAEVRVRQYCAPIDAKRLGKKTSCVEKGYCMDCKSNDRICNSFVAIRRQFVKGRIQVILVGKSLGY